MKKLLFWFLFLFVGVPAFALFARYIPKSDYPWVGGIMLIGLPAGVILYLGLKGWLPDLSASAKQYDLDKARRKGYQQGRNEAMRRNW